MRKKLLILPPLVIGLLVLYYAASNRAPLPTVQRVEPVRTARVIEVPRIDLAPVAIGYGNVRAERTWNAVAEVAGRVVEVHPNLREGAFVGVGELLLRIDAAVYALALARAEAQHAELLARWDKTRAALAIEQQSLALARREAARQSDLQRQGTVSQKALDEAQRSVLNGEQAVQSLETQLAQMPAQQRLAEVGIEQARLDLARTDIRAPFDARIGAVGIEVAQYVTGGQPLFVAESIDRAEIEVPVAIAQMRALVLNVGEVNFSAAGFSERVPELLGLSAEVRVAGAPADTAPRAARVLRTTTVDSRTRTVGVVIAVDAPYADLAPGVRPPLVSGLYVRVKLVGRPQPGRVVVPTAALRNGRAYVLDDAQRLQVREVKLLFSQGGVSVVAAGLEGGERLVVSDLVPAVPGMRIDPVPDPQLEAALRAGGPLQGGG
jgi:RND family efflux transporter MFP subunit